MLLVHIGARCADGRPEGTHGWCMTTTDDTTTVRLSGRRGLLAAIPAMLGFHPQESLVMICLSGPRRRVGPVIRVDLDDPTGAGPSGPDGPVSQFRAHARRYSDEVALVCFTDRPGRSAMFEQVLTGLQAGGINILDAVMVRLGRAMPANLGSGASPWTGEGDLGTDVPGADDPQALAMAAASALHGGSILPNRLALQESISGPSGRAGRQASAALHVAANGLMNAVPATGAIDHEKLREMATVAIDRALGEVAGSRGVEPATCALIALLLADVNVRDHVITRSVRETGATWIPMLIAVARAVPDEDAAEVCSVLAVAAYRRGDGALAQVAVDRCLTAEPDHRLAHLMLGVMAAGLPPGDLVQLAASNTLSPGTDG